MNILKYKRLLNLRKSEETMLFYMILTRGDKSVREIIKISGINYKRAWYILEKWIGRGIYNCGVSLDMGWLELEKLPADFNIIKEKMI